MNSIEHHKAYEEHTLAADQCLRDIITGIVLLVVDHSRVTPEDLHKFAKASREYTDNVTRAAAHLALSMQSPGGGS